MSLHELGEALRALGMDVIESREVEEFMHVPGISGLLECRRKKYRRYEMLFNAYRGVDCWYLWCPAPTVLQKPTPQLVIEVGRAMRSRRYDPKVIGAMLRDIGAKDVTDCFY